MNYRPLDRLQALQALAYVRLEFSSDNELDRFLACFDNRLQSHAVEYPSREERFYHTIREAFAHHDSDNNIGTSHEWTMQCRKRAVEQRKNTIMDELRKDNPFASVPSRHEELKLRQSVINYDIPDYV